MEGGKNKRRREVGELEEMYDESYLTTWNHPQNEACVSTTDVSPEQEV